MIDLDSLTIPQLQELLVQISTAIRARKNLDMPYRAYNRIRDYLLLHYGYLLRPWDQLKKLKQEQFSTAWDQAESWMSELGFTKADRVFELLVAITESNPDLQYHQSIETIIESLEDIQSGFDSKFPGYRTSTAFDLMLEKINGSE